MSLEQKDLEIIDRITYRNSDDVAVSISRSFERLESRIDGAESRIYMRLSDIEDKLEGIRQEFADEILEVKSEIRDYARIREKAEWE